VIGDRAHQHLVGAARHLFGAHADLDDRAGKVRLERRRGVVGHDVAVIDHGDAVGQAIGLFEVLRGEQHRRALGDQLADDGPQLGAALNVEARGGLVQKEYRRALHEGGGHVEAPPHAARVGAHRPVGGVAQVETREQLVGARPHVGAAHLGEPADETQVLAAGEVGVDGRALAGEPDLKAHLRTLAHDVVAHDLGVAAVGAQDGGQHAHRGRLAGAVGAEQAEDAARRHLEVDAVERRDRAESLGQPFHQDGCIRHEGSSFSRAVDPVDGRFRVPAPKADGFNPLYGSNRARRWHTSFVRDGGDSLPVSIRVSVCLRAWEKERTPCLCRLVATRKWA
jgi:hypothetical protein